MNPDYWEQRWRAGRGAGDGSVGEAGERKTRWLSAFFGEHAVESVIDWGCGDGRVFHVLDAADGVDYMGIDVSPTAIDRCIGRWPDGWFLLLGAVCESPPRGWDCAVSIDVVYHLVDDAEYAEHLRLLFGSATRFVVAHATNLDEPGDAPHMRHRPIVNDAPDGWTLIEQPDDPSVPGFYAWRKT